MASAEFPFNYAAHKDTIQKQLPKSYNISYETYYIRYNNILLYELQNDCGYIYMTNLYYLTDEVYKDIEEFASLNGYSKILCTLSEEYSNCENILQILEDNGFTVIKTGFSNRSTSDNEDNKYSLQTWLCFKVILPKIKGYV